MPLTSRGCLISLTLLLLSVPLAFTIWGVVGVLEGSMETAQRALGFGGFLFIPFGLILLFVFVRRRQFVKSLDADGVTTISGQRFSWGKLHYVDYRSRRYRSRAHGIRWIEDHHFDLVFENGKSTVSETIYDRERIWVLIKSMPVQVRYDGVIRENQPAMSAGNNVENRDANFAPVVSIKELINLTARPTTQHETLERLKREEDEREEINSTLRQWRSGQIEAGALLRKLVSFDHWVIPAEEEEFYTSLDENRAATWAFKEEDGAKRLFVFSDAKAKESHFPSKDGFASLVFTGIHLFGALDKQFDSLYINPSSETAISYDREHFPMLRETAAAVKAERQCVS